MSAGGAKKGIWPALPSLVVFHIAFWWHSIHLVAFYPGFLSFDGKNYLDKFSSSPQIKFLLWESLLYGNLLKWSFSFGNGFTPLLILQIFLASLCSAYAFFLVQYKWKKPGWAVASFIVTVFLSANPFMLSVTERDILFSWLINLGFLLGVHRGKETEPKTKIALFVLFLSTMALATLLRKEGCFLSFLLPLFLPNFFSELQTTKNKVKNKILSTLAILSCLLFFANFAQLLGFAGYTESPAYLHNTLYRPMIYILQRTGEMPGFRATLEEEVRTYPVPSPLMKNEKVVSVYLDLVRKHPFLFLQYRLSLLGIAVRSPIFTSIDLTYDFRGFLMSAKQNLLLFPQDVMASQPIFRFIFLTIGLGTVFCFSGLFLSLFLRDFRSLAPIFFTATGIFMLVFFLQPTPRARYFYTIYLVPQLFFPFYLAAARDALNRLGAQLSAPKG